MLWLHSPQLFVTPEGMQCLTLDPKQVIEGATLLAASFRSLSASPSSSSSSEELWGSSNDSTYGTCIWHRTPPTSIVFTVYAFIVPVLAVFGLCANFINAIVFMRPKMSPSAFTYLAALSWLDCTCCVIILFTAFSRSIFYDSVFWLHYDFQWQVPLFGFTTGAANLMLACVSLDRYIYLRHWNGNGPPRFCRRRMAKRLACLVVLFSFIVNLPYFFVFVVHDDGTLQVTPYYFSTHYKFHNWFTFVVLTVLPAVFLIIGNAVIIIAFHRWAKQGQACATHCKLGAKLLTKRFKHQTKLTITILIVCTLYLVGELPAHLTSRKSALNLMFGGDISKVDFELMEKLELICITLNALQLSLNIIVYALINPTFMPEFFVCLRNASDTCYRWCYINDMSNCWRRHYKRHNTLSSNTHDSNNNNNSRSNSNNNNKQIQIATIENAKAALAMPANSCAARNDNVGDNAAIQLDEFDEHEYTSDEEKRHSSSSV